MTIDQQSQSAATERTEKGDPGASPTAREKAQETERKNEGAAEEMREFEAGEPPTDLKDWPSGPAQYLTYGDEDEAYGADVTAKLGPSNLQRFADGSITVDGDKVDDPEDYKGEPLPGGPTDSKAPN